MMKSSGNYKQLKVNKINKMIRQTLQPLVWSYSRLTAWILSMPLFNITFPTKLTKNAIEALCFSSSPVGSGSGPEQSSPVCGLSVWIKQLRRWLHLQPAASAGVSHLLAPEVCQERARPLGCGGGWGPGEMWVLWVEEMETWGATVEFGKMMLSNRRLFCPTDKHR